MLQYGGHVLTLRTLITDGMPAADQFTMLTLEQTASENQTASQNQKAFAACERSVAVSILFHSSCICTALELYCRAFLNVNVHFLCLHLETLANGRLRRLAVRRKLEEACWRWSHAHCCRWRWRRRYAPGTHTEPQVEPATYAGVILPETLQFLLLCSLQLWLQLQRCRQTRARVQVLKNLFYFRSTETVRRER